MHLERGITGDKGRFKTRGLGSSPGIVLGGLNIQKKGSGKGVRWLFVSAKFAGQRIENNTLRVHVPK